MGKAVTRGQALEMQSRFASGINWDAVDGDKLQAEVIDLPPQELGRRFTQFVANGCRLVVKGPAALILDRAKLPTPAEFIGKGWEAVEYDERSLKLTEIDFSKAVFGCPLREGEHYITGEEKLKREKGDKKLIRLDFGVGAALFQEQGQSTLRFLHDTFGVTWMEFTGTVLRLPGGRRCFFCLYRGDGGSWGWRCGWLGLGRVAGDVSVRLAS